MKLKYLEGTGWDWCQAFQVYYEPSHLNEFYVYFTETVDYIKPDYPASKGLLFEEGGSCYISCMEDYCLSAVYHGHKVKEYYYDMIDSYGFDKKPYVRDLYLDVVVTPSHQVHVLDEDELKEAYEEAMITQDLVDKAYRQSEKVIKFFAKNRYFYKKTRQRHDEIQKRAGSFQNLISLYGPFETPLFYKKKGLRFELANDLNFEVAFKRAKTLYDDLFRGQNYLIINAFSESHVLEPILGAKAVFKSFMASPYDDRKMVQFIYDVDFDQLDIDSILKILIMRDFESLIEEEIMFLRPDGLLMCVYDDCGCDIVAGKETLKDLFYKHYDWLLKYDLRQMEDNIRD